MDNKQRELSESGSPHDSIMSVCVSSGLVINMTGARGVCVCVCHVWHSSGERVQVFGVSHSILNHAETLNTYIEQLKSFLLSNTGH